MCDWHRGGFAELDRKDFRAFLAGDDDISLAKFETYNSGDVALCL